MRKIISLIIFFIFVTLSATSSLAAGNIPKNEPCDKKNDLCAPGLVCQTKDIPEFGLADVCQGGVSGVIGNIKPPEAVSRLGFGAEGLSNFFNTAIQLIYIVAGILFVFMVIISALQWITSGGDKEAVAGARNRLTFAIIGIIILALAFVLIRVLGQITGFEFFVGQNP